MKLDCLQSAVCHWLSTLGRIIGKEPRWFIVVPVILCISLSSGFLKFNSQRDINKLFSNENGRAAKEMKLVQNLFRGNTPSLATIVRETDSANLLAIQIMPKDKGSIFRKKIFDDLLHLDKVIRTFSTTWEGKSLSYDRICGEIHGECERNKVLELASLITENGLPKHSIKYPIDMNNVTFVVKEYILSLGGIKTDDKGYVVEGKAVRFVYTFDTKNNSKTVPIQFWLRDLNRYLNDISYQYIKYNLINIVIVENEMANMMKKFLLDVPIVISAIAIFSFLSSMTNNLLRSKPLVGLSASISAILAIGSGMGLCLHLGVPCTDFHLVFPFGILATEVDDAFVMIATWRRTNSRDTVETRMKETYSSSGVSITITSITNIISYCSGIFTPFPVIRYICIHAAVTTIFSYIYLITFFGGCLALDGYREERELHPFTIVCKKGLAKRSVYESEEKTKEEFLTKKFRTIMGNALNYFFVKLLILIIFFVNLGMGLLGLSYLETGNDNSNLFSDSSATKEFIKWNYQYFNAYNFPVHIIFNYPLNYADPKIQASIEDLMVKIEAHPHIAESTLRISWLKYYKLFQNSIAAKFSLSGYNMSKKSDFIDGLYSVFLNIHRAKEFKEDIVFDENVTDIVASRFLIPTKQITDQSVQLEVLNYVYKIADESPIPFRVFSINFHLIEQMKFMKQTILTTAAVASCIILLVFFIFVPSVSCSLCISFVVICMFFETVGYMSLWGVRLDMTSLIALVSCIGFSINYPTHICFSCVKSRTMDPKARIDNAFYEIGVPVIQGSVSTILGVIFLAFTSYYVARSFFKIIFIISLETVFHSLFFIPVLLLEFERCYQKFFAKQTRKQEGECMLRKDANIELDKK